MMSTKRPLSPGEYFVRQADPHTGVPLTADERWATPGQEHEEVFPSLEAAAAACRARLLERPGTEWWIYDHDGKPIRGIWNQEYWESRVRPSARGPWQRILRLLGIRR